MKIIKTIPVLLTLLVLTSMACTFADISKTEAEKRIEKWYTEHPDVYEIDVKGNDAVAEITRYHTERPEEHDDLIQVNWKGMTITMSFSKPLSEIEKTAEAFQEHFWYVAIDDIYADIDVPGWEVYPRTPVSSNDDKKCVQFTEVTADHIAFELNWETYTVFGYSDSNKCQEELEIMDAGVSEECYVGVEKRLPLKINVEAKYK